MASKWNVFGNKENKTPEDQSQSDAAKNELLDAFAARAKEEIGKELAPLREKVDSVAAWQAKIEKEAEAANAPDPNKNADGTELSETQRLQKENRALLQLTALTNARITENEIVASIERDWPEIVPEFKAACAKTSPDQKANPNYAQNCYAWIDAQIGRKAREKGLRYDKNNKAFIIEDGASGNDGDRSPLIGGDYDWEDPRKPGKRLTGMQQLEKLGLTKKDFEEMQQNGQLPS
jgi:hypothetical protein